MTPSADASATLSPQPPRDHASSAARRRVVVVACVAALCGAPDCGRGGADAQWGPATDAGAQPTAAAPPPVVDAGVVEASAAPAPPPKPPPFPLAASSTLIALQEKTPALGFASTIEMETTSTLTPTAAVSAWEKDLKERGFLVASTEEGRGTRIVAHSADGDARLLVERKGPPTRVVVEYAARR